MPGFVIVELHAVTSNVVSKAPCGCKTRALAESLLAESLLAESLLGPRGVTGPGGCKYGVIFDKDAALLNCEQDLAKNVFFDKSLRVVSQHCKPVSEQHL